MFLHRRTASVLLEIYIDNDMENREMFVHCKITLSSLVVTLCTTKLNIQKFYILHTECIYVFFIGLIRTSKYCPKKHRLTGFYNPDGVCLLPFLKFIKGSLKIVLQRNCEDTSIIKLHLSTSSFP
jgi:hypothetical protein